MSRFPPFTLPQWIENNAPNVSTSLAGSLGQGYSFNDLKKLSTDPEATAAALKFDDLKFSGSPVHGGMPDLRQQIAALYDQSKVKVTADDVIIANATTGANALVIQALIEPGDHVVVAYPIYGPLLDVPKIFGAKVDYWKLDPEDGWRGSIDELKALIKPSTKMLILNNPNNPTGSVISSERLIEIHKVAAEHNVVVLTDEIFRPLFQGETPLSGVEIGSYDRTVVTGSLSKTYGFGGIRIGWVVTRNREIRTETAALQLWALMNVSMVDEIVAKEVLSDRCRPEIVSRNISNARRNLETLEAFVKKHENVVSWVKPAGGSTAFVKFSNARSGQPLDDVALCQALIKEQGLLLSPGSLSFANDRKSDFRGYVRIHLTALPPKFEDGLERLSKFLATEDLAKLSI